MYNVYMSANEDHIFKSGAVDTAELRSEQWPLRIFVHSAAAATLSEPTTPGLQFDPAEDPVAEDAIATPTMGSLDRSIISGKVKEVLSDIKTCYDEGLAEQPDLTGRVVVEMVIGKDGLVSSAESDPKKTTLDSAEVIDCVAGTIAQLEFSPPEGDGIVLVVYPFAFAQ